uniref:Uncharacterized protein n=1 Tax=Bracon brevicornis TaxID=1563983 RepID=A0A6V7JGH7_9HYME
MSGSEGVGEFSRVLLAMFPVPNGDHVRRGKETFELFGQYVSSLTKLVDREKNIGCKIQSAAEAAEEMFERLKKLDKEVTVVNLLKDSMRVRTIPSLVRERREHITPHGPEGAEYSK